MQTIPHALPSHWNGRPYYVIEEKRLLANLELITDIARQADVEFILAFKAFALWKIFPVFRKYIRSSTASSLWEARMAVGKFGSLAHTYSPAYEDGTIREMARLSSHLTFNSLSQFDRFHALVKAEQPTCSIGLRINPEYSEVGTALYNPCAPGTRFGISFRTMPEQLPPMVEGFHCHCHCESGADVFERTLKHIEDKFARWFPQLKWINFGGGHLVTREDYDIPLFLRTIKAFKERHPHLHVIFEPGSAFAWQTGSLVSRVVDVVEDSAIRTAILNVSFTCHMPDCLEMPYHPAVRGASLCEGIESYPDPHVYRLGGNSCLSGDFMGSWQFDRPLKTGDTVIFEDMIHYTTVKTNMFNGIGHPSLLMLRADGSLQLLREYGYDDYLHRMD